jgi:hypothetical protein
MVAVDGVGRSVRFDPQLSLLDEERDGAVMQPPRMAKRLGPRLKKLAMQCEYVDT